MEKNRKRRKCGIEGQVNKVSGDLISRKVLIADMKSRKYIDKALCEIFETVVDEAPTAFDKEKVIEELKSWEKASHDAGIQSTYAELDNKASGYYQESRAYHRAIEIVEKGGIR